ncbi:hypothetical protein P7K49_002559 [Saguinus oedipus]|uniref:Uncharacterized protein n=1 Tax=Saguinus oedipus TaxID=9490 RepID=A0ABQ9WHN5_SAGOE|nr:hypothetical protein P7K49_002559 [Saguinus oedipus]
MSGPEGSFKAPFSVGGRGEDQPLVLVALDTGLNQYGSLKNLTGQREARQSWDEGQELKSAKPRLGFFLDVGTVALVEGSSSAARFLGKEEAAESPRPPSAPA